MQQIIIGFCLIAIFAGAIALGAPEAQAADPPAVPGQAERSAPPGEEESGVATEIIVYNVRDIIEAAIAVSDPRDPLTHQEVVDQLAKTVTDLVDPESWRDNGGNVGAIRELMGLLIVTQTPENQKKVKDTLTALRAASRMRGGSELLLRP